MCSPPFQAQISVLSSTKPYLCINNLVYGLGVQSMPSLPIIFKEPIGSERSPYGFKNRVQNLLWN